MADVERVTRISHAHETNAVNYGHLGTATYDDQLHSWTFLRQNRITAELDLEGRNTVAIALDHGSESRLTHPTVYSGSVYSLVHEQTWVGHSKETSEAGEGEGEEVEDSTAVVGSKDAFLKWSTDSGKNTFLKQIPDAAFAVLSLRGVPFKLSSTPRAASRGNSLAFGNARVVFDHDARNDRVRPIVAFTAGPGGETLRLTSLDSSDVRFPNRSGFEEIHTVPAIGHQCEGHWVESAERILHISSAPTQYRAQFLVVKPSATSILHPLISDRHSMPRALGDLHHAAKTSNLRVDPCPVVTIPASRTGGNYHAHSAFHPQDQRSLAVVDICGVWSIWKLRGARARSARMLYHVHLQCSNDLDNAADIFHVKHAQQHYDGWHRVCWLKDDQGSYDRLLVCNRRVAAVFDLSGACVGVVDMRLGPLSDQNRILDVKHSERRREHIVVLTTSRLLIFSSSKVSWKDRSGVEPLTLACSWNHFRDGHDLSLRMSLCELPQATAVLVYSRTSHLSLVYHFGNDGLSQNTVSLKDPSVFQMPRYLQSRMEQVSDVVLCPIKPAATSSLSTLAECDLLKLIACLMDGTMVEAVYKHGLGKQLGSVESGVNRIFSLSLAVHPVQSARYVDEDETDDFVVDDDAEEQRVVHDRQDRSHTDTASSGVPHFRNWDRLLDYDILRGSAHPSRSFDEALDEAAQRVRMMSMQDRIEQVHLLSNFSGVLQISDVEQDSESLGLWLDELGNSEGVSVERVGLHLGLFPPGSSQDNLLELYDGLIASYIETLSSAVTDRNRVNCERLVRQAAAEAFTSNVVLSIGVSESAQARSVLPERHASSPPLESDMEGASSSQISASQSPLPQEEPAVARLRRYAVFQEEVPPLLLDHNPTISSILAHLPDSIDEDPAEYSYREITQRVRLAQEEIATQSLDPRERRKAAKHAARLQRKLEKTAKMSQDAMMQRTLLPSIATGATGVTLPGREVQSSQQAAPESSQAQEGIPGLSMTQPERGAFGARPAKVKAKGKGSKRRAGF
ncbi:hypothetical protein A1O1_06482 [Capronia coronata CBS 617.96]|uniref:RNA polymerase I-specific transcription initiation factor RRN6-like protein n=1 Tax=Capronia coronata CBS 617.96 TaxID=1182541 RepID=W9Y0U5_9EURO|nr:uncharacterized protein A1O1_06482 [Capronia coronata CBS 617.96]EXJ86113.1 hypothetical protein A1O1_06482 [Capronia coronata CBS 617.96]